MATQIEMLECWDLGCKAIENKEYPTALKHFDNIIENSITPPANIYYNKSTVHFILDQFPDALADLDEALAKNEHMAIGYFQRGIVNVKMRNLEEAMVDFNKTMEKMRGNLFIDYKQLGMNYKLSQIEIKINIAYCINAKGRGRDALSELQNAAELNIPMKVKVIEGRVDQFKTTGKVALLMLPTEACSFKPPQNKLAAAGQKKDYLQKDKGKIYVEGEERYVVDESESQSQTFCLAVKRPPKPAAPAPILIQQGANRRAPPPIKKPPLPSQKPERPPLPPVRKQDSKFSNLIVKVHYTFTVNLFIDPRAVTLGLFKEEVARKFSVKSHMISLWYKPEGNLVCIYDEPTLKHALSNLKDGYRLTIWAFEEKGVEGNECIALYKYTAIEEGDLSFKAGQIISIKNQINEHWLEGSIGDQTGMFPRSYVKID